MKKTTKIFSLLLTLFGLALVTGCTPITDTPDVPEETTYTVTFKDGDSTIESQTIKSGEKATKPADPTKTATNDTTFTFDNWYTSTDNGKTFSESAFDFNTPITSDITLYAKWNTTALYSITIESANGTVTASPTCKIAAGEKITLTVEPAKGYELDTLSVNNGAIKLEGTGDTRTFTMPAGNVTVNATFKLIKYKVTYAAYTENGVEILSESTADFVPGAKLDKEFSISDVAYVKYSGTMGNADITLEPELWFKAGAPVEFYYKETLDILIDDEGFKQWKEFFKINESGKMITKEDTNKKTLLEIFNKNGLSLKKMDNGETIWVLGSEEEFNQQIGFKTKGFCTIDKVTFNGSIIRFSFTYTSLSKNTLLKL